jgi:hypothetical protein
MSESLKNIITKNNFSNKKVRYYIYEKCKLYFFFLQYDVQDETLHLKFVRKGDFFYQVFCKLINVHKT